MNRDPKLLNKIQGSLIGGAAGDALGYTVEFMSIDEIFKRFGSTGIQEYELDKTTGKALISDDTQMSLFTANGLLIYDTRPLANRPLYYVRGAYQDWLKTQEMTFEEAKVIPRGYGNGSAWIQSWLCDVPELYSRRAPGNTCISALQHQKYMYPNDLPHDYIVNPQNNSKGCGGIMRVAPLGLFMDPKNIEDMDLEAAQIAAITHGNSLGYMPAAVLAHIVNKCVLDDTGIELKEIIVEARETVASIFKEDTHIKELTNIIDLAIQLSDNDESDLNNIIQIGEGWVAEETLGVAIYCSLRHKDDFSAAIISAVNHSGDSDSTGAVTGNILGAFLGFDAIEEKWKKDLELYDVILEMASDLHRRAPHGEGVLPGEMFLNEKGGAETRLIPVDDGKPENVAWITKYCFMNWKEISDFSGSVYKKFIDRLKQNKELYIIPHDFSSRKRFVDCLEIEYGIPCDSDLTKQEVIDSSFPITVIYNKKEKMYTCKGWNITTAACAVQSKVVFSEDEFYSFFW